MKGMDGNRTFEYKVGDDAYSVDVSVRLDACDKTHRIKVASGEGQFDLMADGTPIIGFPLPVTPGIVTLLQWRQMRVWAVIGWVIVVFANLNVVVWSGHAIGRVLGICGILLAAIAVLVLLAAEPGET